MKARVTRNGTTFYNFYVVEWTDNNRLVCVIPARSYNDALIFFDKNFDSLVDPSLVECGYSISNFDILTFEQFNSLS